MPPNLIGLIIEALATVMVVAVGIGLPALAVVAIKFFKFKERELAMEMEFRQKSQLKELALDERVQRLEDALTSLDHDVRDKLGIRKSATPLGSRPELEGPRAPQGETLLEPSRTRAR